MKKHQVAIALVILTLRLSANGQTGTIYPTLEYSDLQGLKKELPYIRFYGKDSSLLVFGSNHTRNYSDPQVRQIEHLVANMRPTVILYEGDGISVSQTKKETVETYFEMGLAIYIADSLKINAINIEPNTKDKFGFLMTKFHVNEILMATLGLQITMMQIDNENFDSKFPILIKDLAIEGLPLSRKQQSLRYFYKIYKRYFKKDFSYENFDSREIQAKYNKTKFNRINQEANKFRDQYIIDVVQRQLADKQKVFLLEGGWHAIVCEPAYDKIAY